MNKQAQNFFLIILLMLNFSCNEKRKDMTNKIDVFGEESVSIFYVYKKDDFKLIEIEEVDSVVDILITALSDAGIYVEMERFLELGKSTSLTLSKEDLIKMHFEMEKKLYKMKFDKNISESKVYELSLLYNDFRHSLFFKKLWFIENRLIISHKYLSIINFGKLPSEFLKVKEDFSNIKLDSTFLENQNELTFLLSWRESKKQNLIQDYYYREILRLDQLGEVDVYINNLFTQENSSNDIYE